MPGILLFFVQPTNAQPIRADSTLTVNTEVSTVDAQNFSIGGGTQLGNHLFHSFELFSVPSQGAVVFNNPTDIDNIISRVIGDQVSHIDGLIQTNGANTNLFLINRNGLIFGPNAQLQIGGSFIGSTAESLRFSNNVEFTSNGASLHPLLKISTPVGLQIGAAASSIEVNDIGYTLLSDTPLKIDSSPSLRVNAGRSLVLIGHDINFDGGIVAAPGGHAEIGSVRTGFVSFDERYQHFNYEAVEQFGDIEFSARSLIDTSSLLFGPTGEPYAFGAQGGSLQIQGDRILFQEGAQALIQNFGAQASGNLVVTASDRIEIAIDTVREGRDPGLATTSFQSGAGGDIVVIAPQVVLVGDVSIGTDTFGSAASGNIAITARHSMRFESNQQAMPEFAEINTASYADGAAGNLSILVGDLAILGNGINSQALGSGTGGLIDITAQQITIAGGGSISSSTLFAGQGGDVEVTADIINIRGINPVSFVPSLIEAPTTGTGNAGSVTVNARRLHLQKGGRIGSSSLAHGNAGTVTVNALEFVAVDGTVPNSVNPSLIISSANTVDLTLRNFFANIGVFLPTVPTGDSGNVTINAPALSVTSGAQVTVRNDGTGDAGTLAANVGTAYLSDRAGITASTQQGSGGNIILNVQDLLLLRRGSRLSAAAGGNGNGGNITLNAPIVVALDNSDITASAVQGSGGNIQIDTQAILGTAFRERLTPKSDITVSSELGVSGEVDISTVETDPDSGTVALPERIADSSDQVAAGCSEISAGQFVATGRGGLPPSPASFLQSSKPWTDTRELDVVRSEQVEHTAEELSNVLERSLIEAVDWIVDAQGKVALVSLEDTQLSSKSALAPCLKK